MVQADHTTLAIFDSIVTTCTMLGAATSVTLGLAGSILLTVPGQIRTRVLNVSDLVYWANPYDQYSGLFGSAATYGYVGRQECAAA